jgi:hypothetical protein
MFKGMVKGGRFIPFDEDLYQIELQKLEGKMVTVEIKKQVKSRSDQQNRALHLWFTLLAEELNIGGYDMKAVLRSSVEIPWTSHSIKEFLFKPTLKVMYGKETTKEITTEEINKCYDLINKTVGERCGVHVPFPCIDNY